MNLHIRFNRLSLLLLAVVLAATVRSMGQDAFDDESTWQPPAAEEIQAELFDWFSDSTADDKLVETAKQMWEEAVSPGPAKAEAILDVTARIAALQDSRAAALVELCDHPLLEMPLPEVEIVKDESLPEVVRNNLRLLYGRWLASERLYDEASEQLSDLTIADVVDPAALLFYQAVVHHRMLNQVQGLEAIETLLRGPSTTPRRYVTIAGLMLVDLENLEDESLDHISRRMQDIQRRLDLGRAGDKTQAVENGVIASLDKLIEEMEKQQQGGGGGAGSAALQPSAPAQESRIMAGKGPGEVDPKSIGSESGWGDLPPKEREAALQQISQQFPSHYRAAIEQYFRRSAQEGSRLPSSEER